jgi:hypothetical protein
VSSWLSVASEAIVRDTEVRFGEQIAEQVNPSSTEAMQLREPRQNYEELYLDAHSGSDGIGIAWNQRGERLAEPAGSTGRDVGR